MKIRYRITGHIPGLNWAFFAIGMLIVAISTAWNPVALLGAWVASFHLTLRPVVNGGSSIDSSQQSASTEPQDVVS